MIKKYLDISKVKKDSEPVAELISNIQGELTLLQVSIDSLTNDEFVKFINGYSTLTKTYLASIITKFKEFSGYFDTFSDVFFEKVNELIYEEK